MQTQHGTKLVEALWNLKERGTCRIGIPQSPSDSKCFGWPVHSCKKAISVPEVQAHCPTDQTKLSLGYSLRQSWREMGV